MYVNTCCVLLRPIRPPIPYMCIQKKKKFLFIYMLRPIRPPIPYMCIYVYMCVYMYIPVAS